MSLTVDQDGAICSDLESLEEYYASSGARPASPAALGADKVVRDYTEIGIFTAKRNFKGTLDHLEPRYRKEFLRWIQEEHFGFSGDRIRYALDHGLILAGDRSPIHKVSRESRESRDSLSSYNRLYEAERQLNEIASELRRHLPFDAMAPDENVIFPQAGENSDCQQSTTVHIDSFLYTNDDVDRMCDSGKIPRFYCKQCGSRELSPFLFISHSSSVTQLRHIFTTLLHHTATDGKVVVDIGSRLGCVLYAAHLYTNAAEIVGVEMSPYFCKLQEGIVQRFNMQERVRVICDNIMNQRELLARADVVVLNNVFEFFLPPDEQTKMWKFLYQSIRRPGCYLVTVPSLEKTFDTLKLKDINLSSWVVPQKDRIFGPMAKSNGDLHDDIDDDELDVINVYLTK